MALESVYSDEVRKIITTNSIRKDRGEIDNSD